MQVISITVWTKNHKSQNQNSLIRVPLRYEEIMEAHESEMYRMEREAQKINNEQEKLKQDKLNELRNKFESDINEAIQREQEQVNTL